MAWTQDCKAGKICDDEILPGAFEGTKISFNADGGAVQLASDWSVVLASWLRFTDSDVLPVIVSKNRKPAFIFPFQIRNLRDDATSLTYSGYFSIPSGDAPCTSNVPNIKAHKPDVFETFFSDYNVQLKQRRSGKLKAEITPDQNNLQALGSVSAGIYRIKGNGGIPEALSFCMMGAQTTNAAGVSSAVNPVSWTGKTYTVSVQDARGLDLLTTAKELMEQAQDVPTFERHVRSNIARYNDLLREVLSEESWADAQERFSAQERAEMLPWLAFSAAWTMLDDDVEDDAPLAFNADEVPDRLALLPNYPNPFNPSTQISFTLPQATFARLVVYNVLGEEITVLAEGHFEAGQFTRAFDASALPSGIYFSRLTTPFGERQQKMLLIK